MVRRRRTSSVVPTAPRPGATIRVAISTRISTDEVNQPYSLEAQNNGLEQFVASQPGMEITHRYVDQASGATLNRPGLQQALDDARDGQFDVLLVYRIDRLTRSIVGLMQIVEQLEAAGVALKSATEPIDTQGPVGRMLLQLLGIFAEFERSLLIDRITSGFERKASRGEWLGGPSPYGYTLDPESKSLIVHEDEAVVVHAMFSKHIDERLRATAISNWLNETGRRTRQGRLWSNQRVLRILSNPVYIGKIRHGEAIHEGKHPAIISDDLFERAQHRSDPPVYETAIDAPEESDYLLSGLVRCQGCGGAYIGAGAHGRSAFYRYYVCRARQVRGARACDGPRLPADDLEEATLRSLLATYEDLDLFEEAMTAAIEGAHDELPGLQAELDSVEFQLRKTTRASTGTSTRSNRAP